jgi:hypothetical protein
MKTKICFLSVLLAMTVPSRGALYQYGALAGGAALGAIPDNNTLGTSGMTGTSFMASGLDASLSALTLTFVLQGGEATDLTGYLRLGSADYFDLTSLISGQNLSGGHTYTVDFNNNAAFQIAYEGKNPNNTWTLFFADTVNGDTTTLNGWSLDIAAVPEPTTTAVMIFGALFTCVQIASNMRRATHRL